MFNMTNDDQSPRTLYVGNLSPHVTEELLIALFSQIGECKSCKIIHEPGNDPYAFIEFTESQAAAAALSAMNKRSCLGKEMKVNWATTSGAHQTKVDSSSKSIKDWPAATNFHHLEHYHIFVGDLAPEIDQQTLRDAFSPFGEISDVKIMKDPQTLVHKGYGFVSFVNKVDAEAAIAQMNGQWLGTRKIRTNWATRKVQPGGMATGDGQPKYGNKLDYSEVWSRSSDTNTTVYCGGLNNISEDLIRNTFGFYGQIIGIHPFPDRGYAFVRFATKEAACSAICGVHGTEINGSVAKCSWGKENIEISPSAAASALGMAGSLYPGANAGLASTAAALVAQNSQLQNQLGGNNPWGNPAAAAAGQSQSQNWTANYPWAGQPGYPQATQYWQSYPGYQNPMIQGWGVMPPAGANAGSNAAQAQGNPQYAQMGQYQQD